MLEKSGRLDRAVEFLPDDETLEERERDKTGLTNKYFIESMIQSSAAAIDRAHPTVAPSPPSLGQEQRRRTFRTGS